MARGIAIANQNPDTVVRVIVGNEVLLRRDLPPAELIADIDRVKKAVHQPVAYADVWDFWKQFPEIAPHVDVMLIHLLPYWEDTPTGIDHAVAHVDDAYHEMKRLFPGKQIAIGETGWPSRGRERADAVPGRVNEARFLRAFLTLAGRNISTTISSRRSTRSGNTKARASSARTGACSTRSAARRSRYPARFPKIPIGPGMPASRSRPACC